MRAIDREQASREPAASEKKPAFSGRGLCATGFSRSVCFKGRSGGETMRRSASAQELVFAASRDEAEPREA